MSGSEPVLQVTRHNHRLPHLSDLIERVTTLAIEEALHRTGGERTAAAEMLGISRATLFRRLSSMNGGQPGSQI